MDTLTALSPNETVCFAGQPPECLPQGFGDMLRMRDRLVDAIEAAIQKGKTNFVSGAEAGFDTLAAEQALLLKGKNPHIKCVLATPFSMRFFESEGWDPAWKARLLAVSKQADVHMSLSEHFYEGVFHDRDKMIVDLSSEMIGYFDGRMDGSKYAIAYAGAQNKRITNIADHKDRAFLPEHIARQIGGDLIASMGDVFEDHRYQEMRSQLDADPHIHWGKNLHVLIISDRCGGRAIGIYEYLSARTDIASVRIADNAKAIQKAIQSDIPNIVIFVGSQKDAENYKILTVLRNYPRIVVIMYASVDNLIEYICETQHIHLTYDCMKPMAGFIEMLRTNYGTRT